jgi:pimeloyl-ACP methyl ester carboxylesterase
MPLLGRPDGVEIHYELRGEEGPLLAFHPYWSWAPGVYDDLFGRLAEDHRVLIHHLRGTGRSTRRGPYDFETDIADLEALLEETGPAAAALALADSSNRVTKLAARRPDLLERVVCFSNAPLARSHFLDSEALVASDTVVAAFAAMLERDYRGALRSVLTATNPQLSQEELQPRVAEQVAFCGREAATGRSTAWTGDDCYGEALDLGARLAVLIAHAGSDLWFPKPPEIAAITAKYLPEAEVAWVSDGPSSAPEENAEAIRGLAGG